MAKASVEISRASLQEDVTYYTRTLMLLHHTTYFRYVSSILSTTNTVGRWAITGGHTVRQRC